MAWIPLYQSLPAHRKTREAALFLGIPRKDMLWHLVHLWLWAVDNVNKEGCLFNMSPASIAEVSEWKGKADKYVAALLTCGGPGNAGFLEVREDGYTYLHDWGEYAGRVQARLEYDRERHKVKSRKLLGDSRENPRQRRGNSADDPGNIQGVSVEIPR